MMGKITATVGPYKQPKNSKQFEALLKAWCRGEEVSWSDLMAAWVKAPTAPLTTETVEKVIQCIEKK
ncbi:hypothetical protein TFLX_03915 [Thermoflexales bacterium]|nr:hypothetical protein TFLX_03915 [Thermoflexales bacterium]